MNRLARLIIWLYPARWRARYGDEMEALLADSGADAKTVANLFFGGIRMRFSAGSFFRMAAMLSLVGALLGLGASYLRTPQYESRATLEMTPVRGSTVASQQELINRLQKEQQAVESRTRLSAIINDPPLNLYSEERLHTPLEDVIDEMRGATRIDFLNLPGRGTMAFNIRFEYPDKGKAQETVSALVSAFMEQNQQTQIGNQDGAVLQVFDKPSLPVSPIKPNRYQFGFAGCLLGFLLGMVIAMFRRGGHASSAPMLATNE